MQESDRELLELAAKAGVIEHGADRLDCGLSITLRNGQHRSLQRWNPLDDDADALRLAVQCGIEISIVDEEYGCPRACAGYVTDGDPRIRYVFEDHDNDIFAATRRAIVRAAAEIGRSMK